MKDTNRSYSINIVDNNIIEVKFYRDETLPEFSKMVERVAEMFDQLEQTQDEVSIFFDVSANMKPHPSLGNLAWRAIRDIDFYKIALYGIHSPMVQRLADTIMKESGKYDKIHIFSDRKEALEWILLKDNANNGDKTENKKESWKDS